jgi:hypothetical protein
LFSFRKSQTFDQSLETFGSWIFLLRFLKPIGWYRFSYGFLVDLKSVSSKKNKKKLTKKRDTSKICTTMKKVNKHLPPSPEIHKLGTMDSKIIS